MEVDINQLLPGKHQKFYHLFAGVPNQPHIVELYGLNRAVKTSHLDEFLLDYTWGGTTANIKWVDDEHALAIFPCAEGAQQLLSSSQVRYKVRPYSKASGGALQISAEGEESMLLFMSQSSSVTCGDHIAVSIPVWALQPSSSDLVGGFSCQFFKAQSAPHCGYCFDCMFFPPAYCRIDTTAIDETQDHHSSSTQVDQQCSWEQGGERLCQQ